MQYNASKLKYNLPKGYSAKTNCKIKKYCFEFFGLHYWFEITLGFDIMCLYSKHFAAFMLVAGTLHEDIILWQTPKILTAARILFSCTP